MTKLQEAILETESVLKRMYLAFKNDNIEQLKESDADFKARSKGLITAVKTYLLEKNNK